MGFESVYEFREVELLLESNGPLTLTVRTDQPGYAMADRESAVIDTPTTTGRIPVNVRLAGTVRGSLPQFKLSGASTAILYGAKVYARRLDGGGWGWYSLPVRKTAEGYSMAALPIRPTPEGFDMQPIPIRPTSMTWGWSSIPVDQP